MITKINPFAQIYEAFKGFTYSGSFYNLRKQSTGSKILYSIIISIITSLLLCGIYAVQFATDKTLNQFLNDLPEFTYVNGEFYCDSKYEDSANGTYILIDTTQNEYTQSHLQNIVQDSSIKQVMLISRTNIISYRSLTGEYRNMTLSDFLGVFGIQSFSKLQVVSGYKGLIYKVAMIIALIAIPLQFEKLFFTSLLLTLVALIINAVYHTDEDFPTLYWISFYMQSVFMMIIAIGKPLLNFKGITLGIACLILFIIRMSQTLKKGEPAAAQSLISSTSLSDDFDSFMKNTDTVSTPTAFGDVDSNTRYTGGDTDNTNSYADPFSTTNTYEEPSYNNADTVSTEEASSSSSGLSLKLKD